MNPREQQNLEQINAIMEDLLKQMAEVGNKYKDKVKDKQYQEELKSHAQHIVKSIDDKEVVKLFMAKVENLTSD